MIVPIMRIFRIKLLTYLFRTRLKVQQKSDFRDTRALVSAATSCSSRDACS
jgi:hypothetical protein